MWRARLMPSIMRYIPGLSNGKYLMSLLAFPYCSTLKDHPNVTIWLNPNLENSSSEYAAAVVYHEAMHAYLNANKEVQDELEQHVKMADEYIVWLSDALSEAFPSLPRRSANALALAGLRQVMLDNPPYFDPLIKTYGFENFKELTSLLEEYRSGTKGTSCN